MLIHLFAFSAGSFFIRFLKIMTIAADHTISDIIQLPFVCNGIMVLVCLYFMSEDKGTFCCAET